jgi:hypothetical protein
VAELGDHLEQRHRDVVVACQEATVRDLQEVQGELLAAG